MTARTAATAIVVVVAALIPARALAAETSTTEWNYQQVVATTQDHLSHPARWDYKIVVYFTKTTIVELTKKRTGTVRYFVVTRRKRDGGLRLRWRHGPAGALIHAADALDGTPPSDPAG